MSNIFLKVSPPKKTRESSLRIAEATQLGLEMTYIYR